MDSTHTDPKQTTRRIRYAVVGLGHISQAAMLPAFENASENSQLVALVSDDDTKLRELGRKYQLEHLYSYDQYEECLRSGAIDAVYIALPNAMHREYAERAAQAGIHVLCEKPMAVTVEDCQAMIDAAADHGVKLMIAYRLHFEEANLRAIALAHSQVIGEPRLFTATFTQQVKEGDIRLKAALGGGALFDIGIYCINAARYIFREEPTEVFAFTASNDPRFAEVDEATGALLRFSEGRLATILCSLGANSVASYQVIGTEGDLRLDPAYGYVDELKHYLTVNGKTLEQTYAKRDQFGPEIVYFSRCILNDAEPEPSGFEGLADLRIIRAIFDSAASGKAVSLGEFEFKSRPDLNQELHLPPVNQPRLVNTSSPSHT